MDRTLKAVPAMGALVPLMQMFDYKLVEFQILSRPILNVLMPPLVVRTSCTSVDRTLKAVPAKSALSPADANL